MAPGYDLFRCVVNIPDDVLHVGEPTEGEPMAIMGGKGYGAAATLVGKDERNGRVNPALEPDEDDPIALPANKVISSAYSSSFFM